MNRPPDSRDAPEKSQAIVCSSARPPVWPALLIVAAGCIAYANSFDGSFVLDDGRYIADNARIKQLWPLTDVLGHRRPVLDLSLALNYAVGGLNVSGYHAVNLGIHLLASLVLFGVIRRTMLGRSPLEHPGGAVSWPALMVALLWCVHPLQTQSVTYLIQRGESMMGLFYLLMLYCAIRGTRSPRGVWWYVTAVACCALGMGTKAVMVTAPVLLLFYDRAFLAHSWAEVVRRRWALYLGLAATLSVLWTSGVARGVLGSSHRSGTVGFSFHDTSPIEYLCTQAGVLVQYIKLSLWPRPLCLDYDWPVAQTFAAVGVPGVIIVALLAGTVWAWFRRPWLGFLGVSFFVVLAPTSSFIPIRDPLFEHRMYLPLASILTLAVFGGHRFLKVLSARRWISSKSGTAIAIIASVVATSVLTFAAVRRNRDYRTDLGMWQDIVTKRPGNVRARYNVGTRLLDENRLAEAEASLREALRINPRHNRTYENSAKMAHYNLGKVLARQGRVPDAAEQYEMALSIDPAMAEAHSDLGNILAREGRLEEAVDRYERAVRANPRYIPAYFNFAGVLMTLGRTDEAIDLLNQAIALSPETARLHYLLGNAYRQLGQLDAAIEAFNETLRLEPEDPRARSARSAVLLEKAGSGPP